MLGYCRKKKLKDKVKGGKKYPEVDYMREN
jgi:hypothetical protein